MEEVSTIEFVDQDSGEQALAMIRAGAGLVEFTISLRVNGDVLVVLRLTEAEALLQALGRAIMLAER